MFFRTLGLWSLLIAVLTFVVDASKSFKQGQTWVTTSLGEQWSQLGAESFTAFRAIIVEQLGVPFWDNGLALLLQVPTWGFFTALGLLFYWAGRRRHRIEVFSN